MNRIHTPVLIVGAGLAGLTTALLLAWRGVPSLLVERHDDSLKQPRARGVNPRSMELLRVVEGLEAELQAATAPGLEDFHIFIAESVTGKVFQSIVRPGLIDISRFSPALAANIGQEHAERILARRAKALGARIAFSTELIWFAQDEAGVRARLRDRRTSEEWEVEADYLVAADGSRSAVRTALGIGQHGHGTLSHNMSILFQADLGEAMGGRGFLLYYLRNPGFTGIFINTDDPRRALVVVEYDPRRERPADFSTERCIGLVRAALGLPAIGVEILDIQSWEMSSRIADQFSEGRVFLAGDAAHTMPPTGGLGGQTAMQDGGDLAWKLAMVLKGEAGPELLVSYEAERKPVAELTVGRQTTNYVERLRPDRRELADNDASDYMAVAMGYRYCSSALSLEVDDDGAPAEDPFRPSGRPGSRAAHMALACGARRLSTIDLFGRGFVLLAGPRGAGWVEAGHVLARDGRLPLAVHHLGHGLADLDARWTEAYGVGSDGAVLIRPDGIIAWRAKGRAAMAKPVLRRALERALCRPIDARAGRWREAGIGEVREAAP
jgi:aklavinone 12-hydroxylase